MAAGLQGETVINSQLQRVKSSSTGLLQVSKGKCRCQRAYCGTQLPGGFLAQVRILRGNDIQIARVSDVNLGPGKRASATFLPVCQNHMGHSVISLHPHPTFRCLSILLNHAQVLKR